MASIAIDPFSPIRMIEPLPNCLSIWDSAMSSAFSRSAPLRSPILSITIGLSLRSVPVVNGATLDVEGVRAPCGTSTPMPANPTYGVLHGSGPNP